MKMSVTSKEVGDDVYGPLQPLKMRNFSWDNFKYLGYFKAKKWSHKGYSWHVIQLLTFKIKALIEIPQKYSTTTCRIKKDGM